MLYWKIGIIILLIISFFIWLIIGYLDDRYGALYQLIAKKIAYQNENRKVTTTDLIQEFKHAYNPPTFIGSLLVKNYVLGKRNIRRWLKSDGLLKETEVKGEFAIPPRNVKMDKYFSWDSDSSYAWEFILKKKSYKNGIIFGVAHWLTISLLVFIPLSILEFLSPWLSLIIAILIILEGVVGKLKKEKESDYGKFRILFFLSSINKEGYFGLMNASIYTTIFLYLLTSPIIPIENFFENYDSNKIIWIIFSVQSILDALFSNISQTIGINFTAMAPNNLVGRIIVGTLNIFILYSIVELILISYRAYTKRTISFYGTYQECVAHIFKNMHLANYSLSCKGQINLFKEDLNFKLDEFIEGANHDLDKDLEEIFKELHRIGYFF